MNKGFIGPIGDDLPSLIPLIFGLVIFFSMFSYSFIIFDKKFSFISSKINSLQTVSQLKGNSYVVDLNTWNFACSKAIALARNINFVAGLIELKLDFNESFNEDIFSPGYSFILFDPTNPKTEFFCTNVQELIDEEIDLSALKSLILSRKPILYSFPVALQLEHAVIPAQLIFVSWR